MLPDPGCEKKSEQSHEEKRVYLKKGKPETRREGVRLGKNVFRNGFSTSDQQQT